jgi:putative hydrolase
MERYPIDVITHPGEYLPIDTKRLAQAARSNGVALEINASHGTDIKILKTALAEGARFVLSSDAHEVHRVGDVSSAIRNAISASVPASSIINAEGYCWDCEMRLNRLRKLIT